MPRADKAAALVAGASASATEAPVLANGVRVRVLRQFSIAHEIHEVGEILHAPAAFARMLINAGKAEIAVDEPLEE